MLCFLRSEITDPMTESWLHFLEKRVLTSVGLTWLNKGFQKRFIFIKTSDKFNLTPKTQNTD